MVTKAGSTKRRHSSSHTGSTRTSLQQSYSTLPLLQRLRRWFCKRLLLIFHVLAPLLGVCMGVLLRLRKEPYTDKERMRLRFPGELLMNMLNLLVLPLVVSSIISGLTLVDSWVVARMVLKAAGYYLATYLMSAVLGVLMAITILPRRVKAHKGVSPSLTKLTAVDTLLDLIRQILPDNVVETAFQKPLTKMKTKMITLAPSLLTGNATNVTITAEPELIPGLIRTAGINMNGIIMICVAVGVTIKRLGNRGLPLKIFFDAIYEVAVFLIDLVEWYIPIGVFFLVMEDTVGTESMAEMFEQTTFFITVMACLMIHSLLILPIIYLVICRCNPYQFLSNLMPVMMTSIGTSSSLSTLPITMKYMQKRTVRVDTRVVGFVAPTGVSINMNGSAIFDCIAVIFIGYAEGVKLGFVKLLTIGLMSIIAAIGSPGVPHGDLVAMEIVLQSVGIPVYKKGLVLTFDWLLDRFRTFSNVLGDAVGCAVVHHLCKRDFDQMDMEAAEKEESTSSESSTETGKRLV